MNPKKSLFFFAVLSFLTVALIAQANLNNTTLDIKGVSFDSTNHIFHPTSSVPFLSQSLEQRYLTIKSINAIESRFENNGVETGH